MDSTNGISAFIDKQITLLQQEREIEVEESNLLLSNCAPKLLEKKGLALLNLSVASVQVGLGGRRCVKHALQEAIVDNYYNFQSNRT